MSVRRPGFVFGFGDGRGTVVAGRLGGGVLTAVVWLGLDGATSSDAREGVSEFEFDGAVFVLISVFIVALVLVSDDVFVLVFEAATSSVGDGTGVAATVASGDGVGCCM